MKRKILALGVLLIALLATRGQQQADPTFDARVARPAYTTSHPKVLFDEAHFTTFTRQQVGASRMQRLSTTEPNPFRSLTSPTDSRYSD